MVLCPVLCAWNPSLEEMKGSWTTGAHWQGNEVRDLDSEKMATAPVEGQQRLSSGLHVRAIDRHIYRHAYICTCMHTTHKKNHAIQQQEWESSHIGEHDPSQVFHMGHLRIHCPKALKSIILSKQSL